MNRRTFLKAIPAISAMGITRSALSEEFNDVNAPAGASQQIQPADVIKLNPPDLNTGISLMQALKKRKTTRDITDKKLTLQQLSDLLWAADGVNRPEGKRTAPAAVAIYSVDIYVVLPEGVYFYDVPKHELKLVTKGDFRTSAGTQDFVFIAPVNLVFVQNLKGWQNSKRPISNEKRDLWVRIEVGLISQNISLYCASAGLGTTVRGMIDQKKFGEVIKAKPEQVVLAQTIGFPK